MSALPSYISYDGFSKSWWEPIEACGFHVHDFEPPGSMPFTDGGRVSRGDTAIILVVSRRTQDETTNPKVFVYLDAWLHGMDRVASYSIASNVERIILSSGCKKNDRFKWPGYKKLFCCTTRTQVDELSVLFQKHGIAFVDRKEAGAYEENLPLDFRGIIKEESMAITLLSGPAINSYTGEEASYVGLEYQTRFLRQYSTSRAITRVEAILTEHGLISLDGF